MDELDKLTPATKNYEQFAELVNELERDNILQMVKARGRNNRTPSIAFRYKINKSKLNQHYFEQLQQYRLKFHDAINLDAYFSLNESIWEKDLPYLIKINTYLQKYHLPTKKAPAPERSFELVGDEKWIETNGIELLERINLWEQMKIYPVSDPLMFAINPNTVQNDDQFHLIVENKTTYDGLLPALTHTQFSTLTYGAGNKIVKSIENFPNQYPVCSNHTFFYFGDIDRAGLTIWFSLQKKRQAFPALPFYIACLKRDEVFGKTNQRPNEKALNQFIKFFTRDLQSQIIGLLNKGAYYPQEVLSTEQLQHIWQQADWNEIMKQMIKN